MPNRLIPVILACGGSLLGAIGLCRAQDAARQAVAATPTPYYLPKQPEQPWNRMLYDDPRARPWLPVFTKVLIPSECRVTFYSAGSRSHRFNGAVTVGLRASHRYAIAVSDPNEPRREFYGTIEVLRAPLLPPDTKPGESPVPLRFSSDDLQALISGQMVTKIVVLEDPEIALPTPAVTDEPQIHEATLDEDAIDLAKRLGHMVLMVRMGNRIPTAQELSRDAVAGSLLLPRRLHVTNALGQERVLSDYFVSAETGEPFPIRPVSCVQPSCAAPAPCCTTSPLGQGVNRELTPFELRKLEREGYLCDGGDREVKAGVNQLGRRLNIDPGDTVGEFRASDGRYRFVESNRVCLHAPRYAEVRQVQIVEGFDVRHSAQHLARDRRRDVLMQTRGDTERKTYQAAAGLRSRERPTALAGESWPGRFLEVRVLGGFDQGLGWAATIAALETRKISAAEQAVLQKQVDFAQGMSQAQFPQIVGVLTGVSEAVSIWFQAECVGLIEGKHAPGKLVLLKRASRTTADIGDEVVFTIEYKNVGRQDVRNVAIIDNLISRLEYVADSAQCDREAVFSAQENDVGSHTLRWELKEPLKPGDSGTVRFSAKVR